MDQDHQVQDGLIFRVECAGEEHRILVKGSKVVFMDHTPAHSALCHLLGTQCMCERVRDFLNGEYVQELRFYPDLLKALTAAKLKSVRRKMASSNGWQSLNSPLKARIVRLASKILDEPVSVVLTADGPQIHISGQQLEDKEVIRKIIERYRTGFEFERRELP